MHYDTGREIVFNWSQALTTTANVQVSVQPNDEGERILKAGTILGGASSTYPAKPGNILTTGKGNQAILVHDVELNNNGQGRGVALLKGSVAVKNMDADVQQQYNDDNTINELRQNGIYTFFK